MTNRASRWEKVPELSLKQYTHGSEEQQKEFTVDLFEGLKYFGFIILKDHFIEIELIKKCYELSEGFFQLPEETKKKYILSQGIQRVTPPLGQSMPRITPTPTSRNFGMWARLNRRPIISIKIFGL